MYKKGCITYYEPGDLIGPNKDILLIKKKYKDKSRKYHWDCKCPYCGKIFDSVIGNITSGQTRSCGCYKHNKFSNDYTGKKFGMLYVIKETPHRAKNRSIMWLCKCDCGNIKEISTESLTKGAYSCGCIKSKGEFKIRKALEELKINYIQDKPIFKDLLSPKGFPLRFDFYLPDYNICIEYDGAQHEEENRHGSWNHDTLTIHDNIKNEYCKTNNIILIRIPYTQYKLLNTEYIKQLIKEYKENNGKN